MSANGGKSVEWLIGRLRSDFTGSRIPSKQDVLSVFFHYHHNGKETISASARIVALKLISLYKTCQIRTREVRSIVASVQKLFKKWQLLNKQKTHVQKKQSITSRANMRKFRDSLREFFDVSHVSSTVQLNSVDVQYHINTAHALVAAKSTTHSTLASFGSHCKSTSNDISESPPSSASSLSVQSMWTSDSPKLVVPAKRNPVASEKLSATLDETGVSYRKAEKILKIAGEQSHGGPTPNFGSYSTIRRRRMQTRTQVADRARGSLTFIPVTVHWDGKGVKNMETGAHLELLPILVTAGQKEQLLTVGLLDRGTGNSIARSVTDAMNEWQINTIAMCFDTTATNTGRKSGACTQIEKTLDKQLLHLTCRHHIYELILEAVFSKKLQLPSVGPEITLFKQFREAWKKIDSTGFSSGLDDPTLKNIILERRWPVLTFLKKIREGENCPRHDYEELLELTCVFLGETPSLKIRAPGAVHRARWMARAIYVLKMFLFREQFKLSSKVLSGIRQLSLFISLVYVTAWFKAPLATSAPRNDLDFLKSVDDFSFIDAEITRAAREKFEKHLWYLGDDLICLSFFDEAVEADTKRRMVEKLEMNHHDERELKADITGRNIHTLDLAHFLSKKSVSFFKIIGVSPDFLKKNVSDWSEDESYILCKNICCDLRVVNDVSERAVALAEDCYGKHTKDHKEYQKMVLTIYETRKKNL